MHNKIVMKSHSNDPILCCKKVSISFNEVRLKSEETIHNSRHFCVDLWLQGSVGLQPNMKDSLDSQCCLMMTHLQSMTTPTSLRADQQNFSSVGSKTNQTFWLNLMANLRLSRITKSAPDHVSCPVIISSLYGIL